VTDMKIISDDLIQRLGLGFVPVGVDLIRKQEDLPPGMPSKILKMEKPMDMLRKARQKA